jgi:hypothetical protein
MTAKTTANSAEMVAGAVSHDAVNWHAIDWQKVNQVVRRLQVRLVKAMQEGRRVRSKPYNACSPTRSAARPSPCGE